MVYATLLSEEDLSRFRTKQCKRLLNGGCNFGLDRCQYSHNEFWNRRCPFYLSDSSFIRYITVMCPNIETKSDGSINSLCLRGGECPFAHSTEEILYHPLFYKTKRCEDYKKGSCNTYYCPYVHGLAETRVPGTYKLPFTNGIDIPNIPNIIIVDKIDISNKNNNNLTHNNKYGKNNHGVNKADSHFDTRGKNMNGTNGYTNDSYYQKKLDCETTSAFSTIDSIFDKNDVFKNNCDKLEMVDMNEKNLVKYSKDDVNFEKINGSINGNNSYCTTISNEACPTNLCKNSNSEINLNFSNYNIKDNIMHWYKNNNNKYSSINSDNLNEFLPGKNSYTHGSKDYLSYSPMAANGSFNTHNNNNNASFHEKLNSDDRSISSKYTPNANKMNNNYNMGKDKQNYSICSTTTHEICFNEHDGTSNELIDGDEEYLENEDNLNEFILKNKNIDKLLNNERNNSSGIDMRDINCNNSEFIKGGSIDNNSDNCGENNELSLLEVIKYLKILYEKISKGNLAFTHEQWGSVAQITYDIIGIIEFNKAIKIKNFQNNLKTTTYNDINKADIFEASQNFIMNKNTNIDEMEKIEENQCGGTKNIQINEKVKTRNTKLGINGRTIIEEIEMINKQNNLNDNIVNTNNNEQNVSLGNEVNDVVSNDSMLNTVTMNMLNFSVDNSDGINDKNNIPHQYKDIKTKKDNFNDNINLDLLNVRDHSHTNFSDLNNDQNALKDSHFLDYYNFNPNSINFGDEKDISEKISPQPLVSFFAFLSE
ncbi:zinc finger protein, putative [Plasmodium yoelii]|uniref:Zinc finger protein n=2 Tax=Plasmodium yoelii TaxID=5861 RepID=A0AAF0B6Q9_PLAYO|nr:zinc finger protein, putative [Plasmodium yoelii]WBY60061.1 zinc finger protein [Plasmodium yoelii yoelii]CDU19984.1 zinc finger protein, putative [Plasmodium yoelii]VTZ80742.1 zinc finger protein, putative [Plasmodium yoelii]|eukprot:XP_022813623.1 zinc finger protein, putative [Plasmodium yoelii]